jgi:hypothetical protein
MELVILYFERDIKRNKPMLIEWNQLQSYTEIYFLVS